jgi:nitric oxide reductase subunit B
MLAIALLLFSWRGLVEGKHWSDKVLKFSFWGLNIGLAMMFLTSLLPIGVLQAMVAYKDGFHVARSAEFWQMPVVRALAHWRLVPDLVIIVLGALPLLWFILTTFPRLRKVGHQPTPQEIEEQ